MHLLKKVARKGPKQTFDILLNLFLFYFFYLFIYFIFQEMALQ